MTVQQASKQLLFQLFHIYEEREANNIAGLVMEKVTEWKRIDRIMNKEVTLSPEKEKLLASYTAALLTHKPVQYVLNEAWFYGMKLYVDENVLIPRPETEELLEWVRKDIRKSESELRILDIGTGSGCIALGLKKKLPLAKLYASDVSEPALEVAKKNAMYLNEEIHFIHSNILMNKAILELPKVDIIISNPPYIPFHDKAGMHSNVVLHEPHLALFVEDNDPLVFYNAIAHFAVTNLNRSGAVFVEIHEHMSNSVRELFIQKGFKNIELRKDLQGKERMVKASCER